MSIVPISDWREGSSDAFALGIWNPFKNFTEALDVWDPFTDCTPFPSSISTFFPNFPGGTSARLDWKETPTAHVIKANLPGLSREQVVVEVEDGRVLKICEDGGKFLSSFALPEDAMIDYLDASMGNGVLVIIVPKEAAMRRPNVRAIEISGE